MWRSWGARRGSIERSSHLRLMDQRIKWAARAVSLLLARERAARSRPLIDSHSQSLPLRSDSSSHSSHSNSNPNRNPNACVASRARRVARPSASAADSASRESRAPRRHNCRILLTPHPSLLLSRRAACWTLRRARFRARRHREALRQRVRLSGPDRIQFLHCAAGPRRW